MTGHGLDVGAELRRLISEDGISEHALHVIAQIEPTKLAAFLADDSSESAGLTMAAQGLSPEEVSRLSVLAAQLTSVREIDDDERLRGILESLIQVCGLTLHNLAQLTGVGVDDLELAVDEPGALHSETKYVLATRGGYLINMVNQAHSR